MAKMYLYQFIDKLPIIVVIWFVVSLIVTINDKKRTGKVRKGVIISMILSSIAFLVLTILIGYIIWLNPFAR